MPEKEIVSMSESSLSERNVDYQASRFDNRFDMQGLLTTAGTLKLTDAQNEILREDIADSEITIRQDGLLFAPWFWYQKRLDAAFGSAWSLVPNGMPQYSERDKLVLWGFTLIIDGKFVDFAIGQQEYFPNNPTMTYGDAIEGAKSNALMRCCKRLGLGIKLWDKKFIDSWKSKYAEYIWDSQRNKRVWRLKKEKQANVENNNITIKRAVISYISKRKNSDGMIYLISLEGYGTYNIPTFEMAETLHKVFKRGKPISAVITDGAIASFTELE